MNPFLIRFFPADMADFSVDSCKLTLIPVLCANLINEDLDKMDSPKNIFTIKKKSLSSSPET
uniref:hypothetical protein n=1 Tax=Acinetobacter baumannii TaxID=470 RepID=UPI00197ADC52